MQEKIPEFLQCAERCYHPLCTGACSQRFDVEQHPTAIRVLPDRLEHQLPINTVEIGLNVQIKYPVVAPAALSRCAHGVDRRFAGPVAVGVGMKRWLQNWLQVTSSNFLGDSVGHSWNT